MDMHIKQNKAS